MTARPETAVRSGAEPAGPPHRGPSLLLLAGVHAALLATSLVLLQVAADGGWPSPTAPGDFRAALLGDPTLIRVAGMLQVGAAIPLGLFAATVSDRLRHLGVRAAGTTIALLGGVGAALTLAIAGLVLAVSGATASTLAPDTSAVLHWLTFAVGGPGHVPFLGLLLAGVAVTSLFARLLPRWLCAALLSVAVVGEVATLGLAVDALAALTAAARLGSVVGLLAVGVALPTRRPART